MLELFWKSEYFHPIWPNIWGTVCSFHKYEGLLKEVKYKKMYLNYILLVYGLITSILEQLWYLQVFGLLETSFLLVWIAGVFCVLRMLVKKEVICSIIGYKILHCCQLYIIYFFTIYGSPVNIIFFVYSCGCLFP
jgi:hypothetical protein